MTERLREKLSAVATMTGELTKAIETRADALIARKTQIEAKAEQAFSGHEGLMTLAEQGLSEVEGALRQLSNSGPLSGSSGS